jgi:hypothetical protein
MACKGSGVRIPVPPLTEIPDHVKVRDLCLTLAPRRVSHFPARLRFPCPGGSGTYVSLLPPF